MQDVQYKISFRLYVFSFTGDKSYNLSIILSFIYYH